MHCKPGDGGEPYGPKFVSADGLRTSIPGLVKGFGSDSL